jgi:hypothetical protein
MRQAGAARGETMARRRKEVLLEDFFAYMPQHRFVFAPTGQLWPGKSVNERIGLLVPNDKDGNPVLDDDGKPKLIAAAAWLAQNKPVECMTWAPGEPMHIRDRLMVEGGWVERPGDSSFNQYHPPTIKPGNAAAARLWLDHVKLIYPEDHQHIVSWLAHRRQRPAEKINHGLVLGGKQGIGKDTLLEPLKYGVGPWNFQEITPTAIMESRFNEYLKAVILRVNEARDLGDVNRFQFYDRMKNWLAAPPPTLRIDGKNKLEYYIPNCCGVVITSNYKDAFYLPADDRRHYVAWSELEKEQFNEAYWNRIYRYYEKEGGFEHVIAYLDALDLSAFNPKAPPKQTEAFWDIVNLNRAPEEAELADVLDKLGRPRVTTLDSITNKAEELAPKDENGREDRNSLAAFLKDRRNRRVIPHRLERCGYVSVRNLDAPSDGLWKRNGKRQAVYGRVDLSPAERLKAAGELPGLDRQTEMPVARRSA